jgi:hypothetical protein
VRAPGKNDLHILVLVAFSGLGWGKAGIKKRGEKKGSGIVLMTCNSAVFWQIELISGVFF